MSLVKHSRVVIGLGPARGLRGTLVELDKPVKPYGKRSQIACDNGETYWFQSYQQRAFFAEDSPEARAILEEHAARVGTPDLDADPAFADAVVTGRRTGDVATAVERIARHADPRTVLVHLDLVAVVATPGGLAGKPPGWRPPALTAFVDRARSIDLVPGAIDRLRRWFADPGSRHLCGLVGGALAGSRDARLIELLRELTASELDPGVVAARLAAGDPAVHADLARLRIVERDGRSELDVGGISPDVAVEILRAIGDRAAAVDHINFIRGSAVAYNGYDLDAWLAWPELARFSRLDLSESFRGAAGLARVLACSNLSPELAYLDLSGCDIGEKGCKALAASKRLAGLRGLRIDAGDHDRTTWGPKTLSALFPEGGALAGLEQLWIRGWKVEQRHVTALIASERAALRTAQIDWNREIVLTR